MKDEQRRAFLAVILSGIILFSWQYFFVPKPGTNTSNSEENLTGKSEILNNQKINQAQSELAQNDPAHNINIRKEYELHKDEVNSFVVSNQAEILSAKSIHALMSMSDIVGPHIPLGIEVIMQGEAIKPQLEFQVQSESGAYKLMAGDKNLGLNIFLEVTDSGKMHYLIKSSNPRKFRFIFQSEPKNIDKRLNRDFVFFASKVERMQVGAKEMGEGNAKWLGVDFNYHLFAMTFKDKVPLSYQSLESGKVIVETTGMLDLLEGDFVFTRKNYDELHAMGDKLELAVDFGIFGLLAVPILKGLQFFHRYFPNYGLAIILLTILIRFITFPLQYKSFKSMKKMQQLQPELAQLRERYKDDPQLLQKQSMALLQKAGANPLSGCLPLLLQMPIFIAFYAVLNNAVELIGSPFFGWIHDLGQKDPFYILPILMTLTMFLQQKLTPSAAVTPPAQQKVMLFLMPAIFGLFMKDLPAGLCLYIFVSTIFGILQQFVVMKRT